MKGVSHVGSKSPSGSHRAALFQEFISLELGREGVFFYPGFLEAQYVAILLLQNEEELEVS